MINQNRASNSDRAIECLKYHEVVFEGMETAPPGYGSDENPVTAEIAWLLRLANGERTMYEGDVFTTIFFPVFDSFDVETRTSVGVMRVVIHWARYFRDLLPASTEGVVFVLENLCDEPCTCELFRFMQLCVPLHASTSLTIAIAVFRHVSDQREECGSDRARRPS